MKGRVVLRAAVGIAVLVGVAGVAVRAACFPGCRTASMFCHGAPPGIPFGYHLYVINGPQGKSAYYTSLNALVPVWNGQMTTAVAMQYGEHPCRDDQLEAEATSVGGQQGANWEEPKYVCQAPE